MRDNASMIDRVNSPEEDESKRRLEELEAADPADAPNIAEELANRLARDLEEPTGTGDPS
jgi:hypothetical protein